jgi:hypothetical protein
MTQILLRFDTVCYSSLAGSLRAAILMASGESGAPGDELSFVVLHLSFVTFLFTVF